MMETAPPAALRAKRSNGRIIVIIIAVFKFIHGCLMILAAVAALGLARPEVNQRLRDWINDLDLGPHRQRIGNWLINSLLHLNAKTLYAVAVGAAIYATVFFTESAGLLLDKLWAEWMVVISTGLLIPVEISEILRHRGPLERNREHLMTLTFLINVAIVIYLAFSVRRRIREHRAGQSQTNSTGASTAG